MPITDRFPAIPGTRLISTPIVRFRVLCQHLLTKPNLESDMKTLVIPWMSEEETKRFLSDIRGMNQAKPEAKAAENPEAPFESRPENSESVNLSLGGL
jgi:hypothetical protein